MDNDALTRTYSIQFATAPPHEDQLSQLVSRLKYKKGWHFALVQTEGPYVLRVLRITVETVDSRDGVTPVTIVHQPLVPDDRDARMVMTGSEKWCRRWLFDRIRDVETHELMEAFDIGGERPFWPDHGNPYAIEDRTPDRTVAFLRHPDLSGR